MKYLVTIIAIVLIGWAGFAFFSKDEAEAPASTTNTTDTTTTTAATTTAPVVETAPTGKIGESVEGRDIMAYSYGTGSDEILFVGGVHGGYGWNTALLGYRLMDYLEANPTEIPSNVKVTVIPLLNPDGFYKVTGTTTAAVDFDLIPDAAGTIPGRFNANNVDLNRNFDCNWQASATWQNKTISAGTAPFSEPEAMALRDYVTSAQPKAVIAWYSSGNGTYAAACGSISAGTKTLLGSYAKASGYPPHDTFSDYAVTGDMSDWVSKMGIPAISVILTTHTNIEWTKNLAGIKAVLAQFGTVQ
jgi:hypothetical protein